MHYVIGDVHGCFDELMEMFRLIGKSDESPVFILIGDLVDRGPKVWETISWAMDNITENGKFQCVMGNHDAAILEWYHFKFKDWSQEDASLCKGNPMPRTKFDFSRMLEEHGINTEERLLPVIEFFSNLPYRKELKLYSTLPYVHRKELHREKLYEDSGKIVSEETDFKIVHAWYMNNVQNEPMQQHVNIRRRCLIGNPDASYIIIHGHTPTNKEDFIATDEGFDRPGKICYRRNAIDVDGGICYGEKNGYKSFLCGICLEDGREFYVG